MNIAQKIIFGLIAAMPWAIESAAPARAAAAAAHAMADMAEDVAIQSKTALEHAIENNDIQSIKIKARTLSSDQLMSARRYASKNKQPQALLALLPRASHEAPRKALDDYFFSVQDATLPEAKTYQEALCILHQKDIKRARDVMETVIQETSLIPNVASLVAQMLHPTVKKSGHTMIPCMHPELEEAITSANIERFAALRDTGWLTDAKNNQGFDALTLAVSKGQLEIVDEIMRHIPFVDKEQQEKLKKIADDKAEYYKTRNEPKKFGLYKTIANIIAAAWPNEEKDSALLNALNEGKTGIFAQNLAMGANPKAIYAAKQPSILRVITEDKLSVFLKMLIDTRKIDLNIAIPDRNDTATFPPLTWAIHNNASQVVRLLLDAGADPNARDFDDQPVVSEALCNDNLTYLQMLIDSTRLDLNIAITAPNRRTYPPLLWAIHENKPLHAQALLNAGANLNTDNGYGLAIIIAALDVDNPAFLTMLIKNRKLNPNATLDDKEGIAHPILSRAIIGGKPERVQLLLDAGADPNTRNSEGKPVVWQALSKDNPIFLKMLIETKKLNVNVAIKDKEGLAHPALAWATAKDKPEHIKLLLQAGANPNGLDGLRRPFALVALNCPTTNCLKMLIDSNKLNRNTVVNDLQGNPHTLVWWAFQFKKTAHAQLLRDAGFSLDLDIPETDSSGRPAAAAAAAAVAIENPAEDAQEASELRSGRKRKEPDGNDAAPANGPAQGNDASDKKAKHA